MKAVAFSLATLVVGALAAPSPKIPSIRYPSLRSRPVLPDYVAPPLNNLAVQLASSNSSSHHYETPTVKAPKTNIWAPLSSDEAASVVSFLHNQTNLNLTAATDAGPWDNLISVVDLAVPNKTESLAYFDKNSTTPPRYAVASIMFNAFEEPYLEDFLVGPLPISTNTTAAPYGFRTTQGTSKIRNHDADADKVDEFVASITSEVDDIVEALLGAKTEAFDLFGIDPLWTSVDNRTISWRGYWAIPTNIFDAETLLPQGLYIKLDITGRDPSGWSCGGWLHNGVYYPTSADFRHAFENGEIEITTRNDGANSTWTGTDRDGPELKYDERPPPQAIAPGGQRFAVDEDAQFVEWFDFSFYWGFSRDSGMRLWDIKYKGERVVYELGLTEALAHYAGNDPVQSGTSYADTFYGFGPYAFELVQGYDCPNYAKYVDTTFHANEISTTHKNSICFFEHDESYPMQRHANGQYVSSTKNIAFKMRSASTVGNYDYSFTYSFYLDGTIEVGVSASGYIQSAYYAQNEEYGYHIHDGLSGSMHTHVLNWKVDVDILGTNNTMGFHKVVAEEISYPWYPTPRKTMKLVRSELESEDDAKLNWPANSQAMYLIYNKEEKNKFAEDRAWRIMPARGGGIHLAFNESSNLGNTMGFATHHLYVTKQKDSEFSVAHANNAYDPYHPIVDFSKYFDGENLQQEDLVLWVNLGMHHVPHTGDLGNTVQTTAQGSFMLSPHNYLLRDPSRQTKQMIRLNYNSSDDYIVSNVHTFGADPVKGQVNLSSLQPDYYDYQGDSNIRKFPYDPLHPYNDTVAIV
ncbi:uncharacterized protein JCM6883_002688 [Sporobolomyces salmoneus]|uniref:uncharacterized protein n=1 Tax=Sporobolomyces salmoneus TaxID=183962 RepID=UPI003175227A